MFIELYPLSHSTKTSLVIHNVESLVYLVPGFVVEHTIRMWFHKKDIKPKSTHSVLQ